ncbi:MAG: hypothetical protein ACI80K_002879 [Paracoccaceae bacterium]|jgi:hypothetical protein
MRPGLSLDLMKLGVALLGVAAVGAWFFRTPVAAPDGDGFTRPAVTALLVDTSASVTRARQRWKTWAIREAGRAGIAARQRGDEVVLVTFDGEVERRIGPVDAETFLTELSPDWFRPSENDLGTELDGAARAAAAILSEPGRAPGSIVVLGDGVPSGKDPSAALLEDPAWRLDWIQPPPPSRVDLGVVRAIAPVQVAPGVAVPVELDCELVGPAIPAGSRLFIDWEVQVTGTKASTRGRDLNAARLTGAGAGAGGLLSGVVLKGTAEVEIPSDACGTVLGGAPRPFRARFRVPALSEGSASVFARVRMEGVTQDPFPENDVAGARWIVGDPVRVLVCAPASALRAATTCFRGPAFDGIEFRGVTPEQLEVALAIPPGKLVGDLPDAVVTIEVPYVSLPASALIDFVEVRGGGWIHSAGWPLTRIDASPLLALAALEPDLEPKPPRDIVFFVDGSGSMAGERWQRMRDAMRNLIPSVPATDTLSLRFFNRTMGPEELRFPALGDGGEETQRARDEALRRLLRMRVPGGATDIVASLFGLARARKSREHYDAEGAVGRPPDDGLVVLISDGETQSILERRKSARAMLAAGRDDFVAIHVGDGRGVTFLKGLLRRGEEVIVAEELGGLLDVLQEAVHDVSVIEGARLMAAPLPVGANAGEPAIPERWESTLLSVQERLPARDPIILAQALPARPTEGATAVVRLDSEALKLSGRSSTFVAAAIRGRGLTVGLAAPLVDEDADKPSVEISSRWASAVRERSGWLAPFLRAAAERRAEADEALRVAGELREPTAVWLEDPRAALGADSPRVSAILLIEHLPVTSPLELVAEFRLADSLAPDGRRNQGRTLGEARAWFLPGAADPRTTRAVEPVGEILNLATGTEVLVSLRAAEPAGQHGEDDGEAASLLVGPLRLRAPGPPEVRAFQRAAVAPGLLAVEARRAGAQGAGTALGPGRFEPPGARGADDDGRGKRGHPWVRWLLLAGMTALFSGGALACRGR